jgi:hypothetical protein
MSEQPIVYQVRALDARGNPRIVHAYETDAQAREAIAVMKQRSGARYIVVPVQNKPDEYWGINFPEQK